MGSEHNDFGLSKMIAIGAVSVTRSVEHSCLAQIRIARTTVSRKLDRSLNDYQ